MPSVFFAEAATEPKKTVDFSTFFGSVIFRQEEPWTAAEAFLCIITAAASADGALSPEESTEILATLHRSQLFKAVNADDMRKINSKVADRLNRRSNRAVNEACEALPEALRLAVFAHAVDIILADGAYVRAEAEFLEGLMASLFISEGDARKIAEVMDMKNRC